MVGSAVSLLCTGDIHIGRRPTRLPDRVDERAHSAAQVWMRITEAAISQEVDAVVLTGDIVDQDNRYFEALGPLERGIENLEENDIPIYAIAGNHDHNILPQLADQIEAEGFHLLGRGGQWERVALERDGDPLIHFDGWSFPQNHFRRDPIDAYDLPDVDQPTVGLLHTEIDSPETPYAPTTSKAMSRSGPDAWLLGHIHAPGQVETDGPAPILYPGSPQPLDPGETGAHGPWIVELDSDTVDFRPLGLATVRYDVVAVDLEGVSDHAGFRARVSETVRDHSSRIQGQQSEISELVLRLQLTGRTPLHRDLEDLASDVPDLDLSTGRMNVTVNRVRKHTRPDLDLDALAEGHDPPAVLAQIVKHLDEGIELPSGLQTQLDRAFTEIHDAPTYADLQSADMGRPLDDEERRDLIREQALTLLDTLMAQKEASGE